jgi:exodeoxyribonuclease-1
VFSPSTIKTLDVRKQFSLENLAEANSIDHSNAHDAMADVETTIDICKIIKQKSPDFWLKSLETTSKSDVTNYIQDRNILCHHEAYYGKIYTFATAHIGSYSNRNNAEINLFFDLKRDPQELLDLNITELKHLNSDSKTKFLRTRRFNRHPIFMDKDYAMSFPQYESIGMDELNERANLIKKNNDFKMKILDWHQNDNNDFGQEISQLDPFWEESLYSMGFASNKDRVLMEKFHQAEWSQKPIIAEEFEQEGYKYFAKKIIYEYDSLLLNDLDRRSIDQDISQRLTSSNTEKWLTIPEAFAAVDDLRDKYNEDSEKLEFLEDYNNNLEEILKQHETRLLTS